MRRLAAIALIACAGLVAAVGGLLPGSGAQAADDYKVDAIFDTAKGIIPGQLVKIAGAEVGLVDDVELTEEAQARIKMTVERRFAPFRANAACDIQPEGLIGENFVQCDPGSPEADTLKGVDGKPPTVSVRRTAVPINLTDLFNIFNLPVRQRFTVVVNELGAGMAGRGKDFNQIIKRANPTLAQARKLITVVNRQRAQVADLVTDTDTLVAELARRRDRVADFIDQSGRVSAQTAARTGNLSETIRRLPPLLEAAKPALANLDQVTSDLPPILANVRAAAPGINRVINDIGPFVAAAGPAIRGLGAAADQGRKTIETAAPVVDLLRRFAAQAKITGPLVDELVVSLRERGVVEYLLTFVYRVAATAAPYDATSHIAGAHFFSNSCTQFAETPSPACDARYSSNPTAQPAARPAAARAQTPKRSAKPANRPPAQAPAAQPAPAATPKAPAAGAQTPQELIRKAVEMTGKQPTPEELDSLVDYLLR